MTDKKKTEDDLKFENWKQGAKDFEEFFDSMLPEPNELERVRINIEEGLRKKHEEDSDV